MGNLPLHQRLLESYKYLYDNGFVHSQTEFADFIGKQKTHVNAAFKDAPKRCTLGLMKAIADAFPDVLNRDWLLTGEGKMEAVDKSMKPHYPATVEAGALGGDIQTVMDYEVEMEPAIKRFPSYDYMIDVSGQSMEPTYFDGDCVACRKLYNRVELTPGKVYVFVTKDGAVIKRYISHTQSSVRVSSDNPDYEPYNIDSNSIMSIAEVVGSIHQTPSSQDEMKEMLIKYAMSVLKKTSGSISKEHRMRLIDEIMTQRKNR